MTGTESRELKRHKLHKANGTNPVAGCEFCRLEREHSDKDPSGRMPPWVHLDETSARSHIKR